tara:strand:- start:303 stop:611 length:309 start_codon:yes stop_codon:yes gene_type:complete
MASMAGLASLLRLFIAVKLCPLWGKSKSCLPKSWQIIAQSLPIYYLKKITAAPLSRPYLAGLWRCGTGMREFITHCLFDCWCQLFVNALQKRPKNSNQRNSL